MHEMCCLMLYIARGLALLLYQVAELTHFVHRNWPICSSLQSIIETPPPTDVTVVALNEAGKVRVTWGTPILGAGQMITGYSVQYRRKGITSYTTHPVFAPDTTSYTITRLNLGTEYDIRVASRGPLGRSDSCCGSGKGVTTYCSEWKCRHAEFSQICYYNNIIIDCKINEIMLLVSGLAFIHRRGETLLHLVAVAAPNNS